MNKTLKWFYDPPPAEDHRRALVAMAAITGRCAKECSGVQMNNPQGHTKDETAPDAQQNATGETEGP